MQEEVFIGNVKLNFKHYAGLDLYSDGPVEKEIFDIVNNSEYANVINNWRTAKEVKVSKNPPRGGGILYSSPCQNSLYRSALSGN